MDHNYYANYNQYAQPGGMAAFLLGLGPMPPPRPEEVAAAVANRMIDGLDGQGHQLNNTVVNNNLQLQVDHGMLYLLFVTHLRSHEVLGARITTRVPVTVNGNKSTRDIEIQPDISREDFVSRICAHMGLDPATAQLGWKSNDDPQRAPARQLASDDDLTQAFTALIKMKNSRRRQKEVVMLIVHLV